MSALNLIMPGQIYTEGAIEFRAHITIKPVISSPLFFTIPMGSRLEAG